MGKNCLTSIVYFFLTIFLILFIYVLVARQTVLSSAFYEDIFNKAKFYNQIAEIAPKLMSDQLLSSIKDSGLPINERDFSDAVKNQLTPSWLKITAETIISQTLGYLKGAPQINATIDFSAIASPFTSKINSSAIREFTSMPDCTKEQEAALNNGENARVPTDCIPAALANQDVIKALSGANGDPAEFFKKVDVGKGIQNSKSIKIYRFLHLQWAIYILGALVALFIAIAALITRSLHRITKALFVISLISLVLTEGFLLVSKTIFFIMGNKLAEQYLPADLKNPITSLLGPTNSYLTKQLVTILIVWGIITVILFIVQLVTKKPTPAPAAASTPAAPAPAPAVAPAASPPAPAPDKKTPEPPKDQPASDANKPK